MSQTDWRRSQPPPLALVGQEYANIGYGVAAVEATHRNHYLASDARMYAQRILPEIYDDGWAHERGENGWCRNCDAPPGCSHARLLPPRI